MKKLRTRVVLISIMITRVVLISIMITCLGLTLIQQINFCSPAMMVNVRYFLTFVLAFKHE